MLSWAFFQVFGYEDLSNSTRTASATLHRLISVDPVIFALPAAPDSFNPSARSCDATRGPGVLKASMRLTACAAAGVYVLRRSRSCCCERVTNGTSSLPVVATSCSIPVTLLAMPSQEIKILRMRGLED